MWVPQGRMEHNHPMLSNNFWYGFLLGAGLAFLIFFVAHRLILAKNNAGSKANPIA
jgi:hypothetical protein